jgi:hypothetical protein
MLIDKSSLKACRMDKDRQESKRRQPNTAKQMRNQPKSIWPALALLLVWLLVAGSLTWQRSRESVIPPVWDQNSYVQKADDFWNGLAKGELRNPLNIEPTVRPPGTILLTAPIGPLKDYRNFYFRSVIIPVVIMVIAIFIAGVVSTGMAWQSAAVALLAGSMPMFWQFDSQTAYSWGMVDSFLASVAALAMACLLVASMKSKSIWTGLALIAIGMLPLIKPSGFLVAAMIGIALVAIGCRSVGIHPQGTKRGWIELAVISSMMVITIGVVAVISKGSAYFSAGNIAFGNEALAQLRKNSLGFRESFSSLSLILSQGVGILPIIVIAGVGIMGAAHSKSKRNKSWTSLFDWQAKIGFLVLIPSLILCYKATLFLQPRYLFPFIAITYVMLTPTLVNWCKRAGRVGLVSIMGIPFGLLVYLGSPSMAKVAEIVGGYGLYSGSGGEEIKLAAKLVREISATSRKMPILFYSTEISNRSNKSINQTAFIAGYSNSLKRLGYSYTQIAQSVRTPTNWQSDPVISIDSIYDSDILAFDMNLLKNNSNKNSHSANFADEQVAWISWLATTPNTGSTAIAKTSPELLVLLVKNRELLEKQMRTFIASRAWRSEFMAANVIKNYAANQLDSRRMNSEQIQQPINFDNRLRVHALAFSRLGGTGKVKATVYSERLPSGKVDNLFLFIHELDSKNNVVAMHELPLSISRFPDRPISLNQTTFQPLSETKLLGVGVYEPRMGSLKTDWAQATDWNGRRAKLDLNSLPPVQISEQ